MAAVNYGKKRRAQSSAQPSTVATKLRHRNQSVLLSF
jgi:hypothetical protein